MISISPVSFKNISCNFGIQSGNIEGLTGLSPSFPSLRPYLGKGPSACGKYGGRLVKCRCVFSLFAVVYEEIVQFQTYESVEELLEYASVEKQPQVKDRSQFFKRFCESIEVTGVTVLKHT